jgi:hypothetical protein
LQRVTIDHDSLRPIIRGKDGVELRRRLMSFAPDEAEFVSIMLYASPQYRTMMSLATKGLVRLMVIDEAHCVNQDGRNFRPEFKSAVRTLKSIHAAQRDPPSIIAMSATFRQDDQNVIADLLGCPPDKVIWLELARRGIKFEVVVSGNPLSSISKRVSRDYRVETDLKTIVYTNSKTQALGSIMNAMENILELAEARWRASGVSNDFRSPVVMAMTGDDGMQFKVRTMHAFAGVVANGIDDERDLLLLPNLVIMLATKAADCGVSIAFCWRSYRLGLAPSMYSIVQDMGRVNRIQ